MSGTLGGLSKILKNAAKNQGHIDPKVAQFANEFMRRLSNDAVVGKDAANLEEVLNTHAEKGADGKIDWTKTADKLVKSLNELIPDDAKRNAKGETEITKRNDMLPSTAEALKELITGAGALSVNDMARLLMQKELQLDKNNPHKKESLLHFLSINSETSFGTDLSERQLAMLKEFMNSITPGLGTMMLGFFGTAGIIQDSSPDSQKHAETRDAFAQGFDALFGSENDFAQVWGLPIIREDGQGNQHPIPYTRFDSPGGSMKDMEAFFDGTLRRGAEEKFDLGEGGPVFTNQSFKTMIVARWEETKLVSFATDQDREDFIDYAKQAVVGGQVGEELTQRLADNLKINFKTPDAREAFTAFVKDLDMHSLSAHDAARTIIDGFIKPREKSHDDLSFQKGVKWDGWKSVPSYDQLGIALQGELQHYAAVHSRNGFAERMISYAEKTPGVTVAQARADTRVGNGVVSHREPEQTNAPSPPAPAAPLGPI